MKRIPFSLIVLMLYSGLVSAQSGTGIGPGREAWKTLATVQWERKYNPQYKVEMDKPIFPPQLRQLNGQAMTLRGYFVPFSVDDDAIILSVVPNQSCFFCGAAGPESVVMVYLKKPRRFRTDEVITVQGQLELTDGSSRLIYNLKNAVVL